MRRSLLPVSLIVASTLAAAAGVTLRYQYEPGTYVTTSTQKMTMTLSTEDPSKQAMLGTFNPMEMETTMIIEQKFEALPGTEEFRVTATLADVRGSTVMAGRPAAAPMNMFAELVGVTLTGITDRLGNRRDSQVISGELPEGSVFGVRGLEQMKELWRQAYPRLPAGELTIGESFTQSVDMSLPLGGSEAKIRVDNVFTLRSFDDQTASLDVVATMTMEGTIDTPVSVDGLGEGKAVFDRKQGFFRDVTIIMDALVEIEDMKIQMTAEGLSTLERTE